MERKKKRRRRKKNPRDEGWTVEIKERIGSATTRGKQQGRDGGGDLGRESR